MDVRYVRAFVETAACGSVGRAAERLHVSQPALSRQIQNLEAEVGIQLFDRIGRTVRLSAAGSALLPACTRLLNAERDLFELSSSVGSGRMGSMSIGGTPQTIERIIAPFLSSFTVDHPNLEVTVREAGGVEAYDLVANGELQIGIAVAQPDADLNQRVLQRIKLRASARPRYLDPDRPAVQLEELAELPVLVLNQGFGSRSLFDAATRMARITPDIVFESAAPDAVLSLAEAGHGVAVLPTSVKLRDRPLVSQPVVHDGAELDLELVAVTHPGAVDPGYVELAVDALVAFAATLEH